MRQGNKLQAPKAWNLTSSAWPSPKKVHLTVLVGPVGDVSFSCFLRILRLDKQRFSTTIRKLQKPVIHVWIRDLSWPYWPNWDETPASSKANFRCDSLMGVFLVMLAARCWCVASKIEKGHGSHRSKLQKHRGQLKVTLETLDGWRFVVSLSKCPQVETSEINGRSLPWCSKA